jgi:hypothetical protein
MSSLYEARGKCVYAKLNTDLKNLKNTSIIGSYWHTYIYASVLPKNNVIATPNPNSGFIRRVTLLPSVLAQPTILFVKNQAFNTFPDSLFLFGKQFVNLKKERILHDSVVVSEYKIHSNTFTYLAKDLRSQIGKEIQYQNKLVKKSDVNHAGLLWGIKQ